jgi:hypothetical protein
LQGILEQQGEDEDIIRGLYGDPQFHPAFFLYRCEKGLHTVAADQVEERDAGGNALCPQHGVPMIRIVKKGNEPDQEQV